MRYVSTRGTADVVDFEGALLAGLARDGGLYVPESWPSFSPDEIRALRGLPYAEVMARVAEPFVGDSFDGETLRKMTTEVYGRFDHPAVAPLVQTEPGTWVMELFHGPTFAFKDYAMQLLAAMFDEVLARRGERVTILGATSGDTGAAAVEACRDRDAIDVFILFPEGRVSPMQQRQMSTVASENVHAMALQGTFDDCQDMVKALFNDSSARDRFRLSAVNSINWARLLPQVAYYMTAGVALGAPDRPVAFSVPTGNFGNVFSAYVAQKLGLPIERLVIATNQNDILTRFFETGAMTIESVQPSISPSMDIQVSSNFERLLFELYDRDGKAVTDTLTGFRNSGTFSAGDNMMSRAGDLFSAFRADEAETSATIARVYRDAGMVVDPHSAVGLAAVTKARSAGVVDPTTPLVSLACAHPAKFGDAVAAATGQPPTLPEQLKAMLDLPERHTVIPNDKAAVEAYLGANARIAKAAA